MATKNETEAQPIQTIQTAQQPVLVCPRPVVQFCRGEEIFYISLIFATGVAVGKLLNRKK